MKARHQGIDLFRIIAALMVVAIHTFPFNSLSPFLDEMITLTLFRVAVPFFFMTTGFYLIGPYANNKSYYYGEKIKQFLLKISKIYLLVVLLYLPLSILNGTISSKTTLLEWLKLLIFDGTLYHLWYFPGIIVGTLLVFYLLKYVTFNHVFFLSIALYVIGLLGDSWYGIIKQIPLLAKIYDKLFEISEMTRNGLFFTPLFLCLGAYLYLERQKERRGVKELSLFFLITLAMMLVESIFLHRLFVVRHDSMYLLLPVVMYFLYLLLLNWQPKLRIKQVQNLSLLIYIIHPVVIVVVHTISNRLTFMKFSLLYYLLVVAGSYILSRLLLSIFKQKDKIKETSYRAEREISTNAVKHNIKEIKKMIPQKTEIIAVVKANAYGADLVEYAKILEKNQVTFFAVATIDEGIKLRKAMIKGDILVLGLTDSLRAKELIKYDLIQSIVSEEYGRMLNHKKLNIRCHVEVDTGMHRLGVESDIDVITRLYQLSFLRIEGIYSHLGSSDSLDSVSKIRTEKQLSVYCHLLNELKERGINYGVTHIQSSYGILNYSEYEFDYVRAGIMLYGFLSSNEPTARQISLKPVMKIKAKLISKRWVKAGEILGYGNQTVLEKERLIGVISIGYADGLPRSLSNNGYKVEYQDYLLPQVGKICMDMMLIDLTQVEKIQLNEEVTVMSDFTEIALLDDTITNETMSQLGNRLTTTVTY